MSKSKRHVPSPRPKPAPKKVRQDLELQAGIFAMPGQLVRNGEVGSVEILMWMIAEGPILGSEIGSPAFLREKAGVLLRESLAELPSLPRTLSVASEDLAVLLRPAITTRIELICRPTPVLDQMVSDLFVRLESAPTYLSKGADPDAVASFFHAAARLYRAKPWLVVPSPGVLLGITIKELEIDNHVLSVSGPRGDNKTWMLCASAADVARFTRAARRKSNGENFRFPPFSMLAFEHRDRLPPTLNYEIASHGWEVVGPNAYPWLYRGETSGGYSAPTPEDLLVGEVVTQALAELATSSIPWKKVLQSDEALVFSSKAKLGSRELEVLISIPFEKPVEPSTRPLHPILAALFDFERQGGEDAVRRDLDQALIAEFLDSPAGEAFRDPTWTAVVLEIAAERIGSTAASIRPVDLEEILLEYFPLLVDAAVEDAEEIVAECAAFFSFLTERCSHPNLLGCLEFLKTEGVLSALRNGLADSRNFGLRKQLVIAGAAAGFDTDTDEGLAAWLKEVKEKGLPPNVQLTSPFEADRGF